MRELTGQADQIRLSRWPVTAVATTIERRTNRVAAGLRNRPQAGDPLSDHHANGASSFAIETDAVHRRSRAATGQHGLNDFDQLILIDRTAAQFKVDFHVVGDGGRGRQRRNIVRRGVDRTDELIAVGPVAQGLNATGCCTGTDRDQKF